MALNTVDLESADDVALADKMNAGRKQIIDELHKRIIGQADVIELVLLSLFVGGNSLIVGVPGLAKTLLIATLARVVDLKFTRIQFTPDLMPSDITGTDIIQEDPAPAAARWCSRPDRSSATSSSPTKSTARRRRRSRRCSKRCRSTASRFRAAPTISTSRSTCSRPRTRSSSKAPIPLPEAQLDRFMFHIVIEHPPEDEEFDVVQGDDGDHRSALQPHGDRRRPGRVPAAGPPRAGGRSGDALRAVARAHQPAEGEPTRPSRSRSGWRSAPACARRSILVLGAKARALTQGRYHVSFEDIRAHGASGAAPPRADQLPRRVGRRSPPTRSSTTCSTRWRRRSRECNDEASGFRAQA